MIQKYCMMRTDWCLPEAGVQRGQNGEGSEKIQTSSYKQVSHGNVMYGMVTVVCNTVLPV